MSPQPGQQRWGVYAWRCGRPGIAIFGDPFLHLPACALWACRTPQGPSGQPAGPAQKYVAQLATELGNVQKGM